MRLVRRRKFRLRLAWGQARHQGEHADGDKTGDANAPRIADAAASNDKVGGDDGHAVNVVARKDC